VIEPADVCPFPGTQPFDSGRAKYFCGRQAEIRNISDHLLTEAVTVLFGPSGVGKSSLIAAGLPGELKKEASGCMVVYYSEAAGEQGSATMRIIERIAGGPRPIQRLKHFLRDFTERQRPLLLLLDQAENYLGRGDFAEQLAEAILTDETRTNFLISVRQEELALLELLKPRFPEIFSRMIRLSPLTEAQAVEAIEGPIRDYNTEHPECTVEFEKGVARKIVEKISVNGEVDPILIQIVCQSLWITAFSQTKLVQLSEVDVNQRLELFVRGEFMGLGAQEQEALEQLQDALVFVPGGRVEEARVRAVPAEVFESSSELRSARAKLLKCGFLRHLEESDEIRVSHDRLALGWVKAVPKTAPVGGTTRPMVELDRVRANFPYLLTGYAGAHFRNEPARAIPLLRRAAVEAGRAGNPEAKSAALRGLAWALQADRMPGATPEEIYHRSWQVAAQDLSSEDRERLLLRADADDTPRELPAHEEPDIELTPVDLTMDRGHKLEI
jgi:hypothetical protein